MWLRHINQNLTDRLRQSGDALTVLLCVAALVFSASPAVMSAFVWFAGTQLSEELPTENHTRPDSQQGSGLRQRVVASFKGLDLPNAPRPRSETYRRLSRTHVFIPSRATELIRAGILLLC